MNGKERFGMLGTGRNGFLIASWNCYINAHNEYQIAYSSRPVLDSRGSSDCVADIDYAPCVS